MTQMDMFTKNKTLSPLQALQVEKIATMLQNMGCKYLIVLPDGVNLGNTDAIKVMVTKMTEKKKRPLQYPMGTWSNYIKPYLKDLKEGEVAVIPFGTFPPEALAKNVCATANGLWGNKSYICNVREDGVEIMRGGF